MSNDAAKARETIALDHEFFMDTLPQIHDLSELKIVLYVQYLAVRRGTPAVPLESLLVPEVAHAIATGQSPEPVTVRVRRSIDRAVANGIVLRLTVHREEFREVLLLASNIRNRELTERAHDDPWAMHELGVPSDGDVSIYRPNIFAYYERHIGPLTPIVAEHLRDAERSYPRSWIERAILEAVLYKKRNWRYIEAILTQWEERGAPRGLLPPSP